MKTNYMRKVRLTITNKMKRTKIEAVDVKPPASALISIAPSSDHEVLYVRWI